MECMAAKVYDKTRGLAAFELCKKYITKGTGNQHGKWYTYADGSMLYIGKDLNAKFRTPSGMCLAARIGPMGRYTETECMVSP